MTNDPHISGKYRHYKGNDYEVLGEGTHSETGEKLVIYQTLHEPFGIWARPHEMFFETVVVNGKKVPRFSKVPA